MRVRGLFPPPPRHDLNPSRRRKNAGITASSSGGKVPHAPARAPGAYLDPGLAPSWWRLHTSPPGRLAPGPPGRDRVILDLCGGSGAWSEPYRQAGYDVVGVTLPDLDVRTYTPPCRAWGILAAPPCEHFSRARRSPRDHVLGMATVNACLRLICQVQPAWWALENPWYGDLATFLGAPQWTFHPYEFGDPWTKPTALWGVFSPPTRRQPVAPTSSAMDRPTAAARAVTPPGFARAFFEANP